jgi:hypothetical protein
MSAGFQTLQDQIAKMAQVEIRTFVLVGLGILFNHKARPESVLSILLASERM